MQTAYGQVTDGYLPHIADATLARRLALADRIDQGHMGVPSFLMVLTSTATGYRRDDGVMVVPLGLLGA